MNNNSKIDTEYRKAIRKVRGRVRGKYQQIAEETGYSLDTVKAVMIFRFRNDSILEAANRLAFPVNESIN